MSPSARKYISQSEFTEKLKNIREPEFIRKSWEIVEKIHAIREKKDFLILAHNYMPPEIFYSVADVTGDSFELAKKAMNATESSILFAGVHFMAETAKILNPGKRVFVPDMTASCSLADGISIPEVLRMKKEHPGVPVLSYVNSPASVKSLSDVIVTSANAVKIVEKMPGNEVILIPDKYLAANVQKKTGKKVYVSRASCVVHELFTEVDTEIAERENLLLLSHLECRPGVAQKTAFSGSTSQFRKVIGENPDREILLMTEYSMVENLSIDLPHRKFRKHPLFCPHMQKVTLEKILYVMENEPVENEIFMEEPLRKKAEAALLKMLELSA